MAKTIQMTLDDLSFDQLDEAVRSLKMTRAAFLRQALQQALRQFQIRKLEEKQAQGYARHPVVPGEFDGWATTENWGES